MKGVFVIGSDTEVGKTVVSAAIICALKEKGVDAVYMKPVGSDGVPVDGRLVSPDALFVARAAKLEDPWELINPVCVPGAMSPLAAAKAAGLEIDLGSVGPCYHELSRSHDFVLVEGVGGLLVPMSDGVLAGDLFKDINLDALVVGRAGLGTINHCLLTIEALKHRGVKTLGFCYGKRGDTKDQSLSTNAEHTMMFTDAPFLGALPDLGIIDEQAPDSDSLARAGASLNKLIKRLID